MSPGTRGSQPAPRSARALGGGGSRCRWSSSQQACDQSPSKWPSLSRVWPGAGQAGRSPGARGVAGSCRRPASSAAAVSPPPAPVDTPSWGPGPGAPATETRLRPGLLPCEGQQDCPLRDVPGPVGSCEPATPGLDPSAGQTPPRPGPFALRIPWGCPGGAPRSAAGHLPVPRTNAEWPVTPAPDVGLGRELPAELSGHAQQPEQSREKPARGSRGISAPARGMVSGVGSCSTRAPHGCLGPCL